MTDIPPAAGIEMVCPMQYRYILYTTVNKSLANCRYKLSQGCNSKSRKYVPEELSKNSTFRHRKKVFTVLNFWFKIQNISYIFLRV